MAIRRFFIRSRSPRVGGKHPRGVGKADNFNNYLAAATVHQLIYDFGRSHGALAAQKAFVKAAKLNEDLIAQQVVFGVTQAFFQVLETREALAVAEESLSLTKKVLEFANAGQETGLRPRSESARAEADVAMAELARIRAAADLDVAGARFLAALGEPDGVYMPDGPIPGFAVQKDEALALDWALKHRPELQSLKLQEQALAQRLRSAGAGHLPRLEALAGINSRGQFARGGRI